VGAAGMDRVGRAGGAGRGGPAPDRPRGRRADGQGARRPGVRLRRHRRAVGRSHPEPGSAAGPIGWVWPRTGSARRTRPRTRGSPTSSGRISGRSVRRRGATSPCGRGSLSPTRSGEGTA
jgi:hypothetical protein